MIEHIVMSGGGPNGLIYLGVVQEFVRQEKLKLDELKGVWGTSAGAILAVILALKLPLDEVMEYIAQRPWRKFVNIEWDEINGRGGVVPPEKMKDTFIPLFKAYDISLDITLEQCFLKTGVSAHIVATDFETFKPVVFQRETHPDMPLLMAMSLSIAVPPVFAPGEYGGRWYIDGAMSMNLPIRPCLEAVQDGDKILALNLVGQMPLYNPPMDCYGNFNYIVNKMVLEIGGFTDNVALAEKECFAYLGISTKSMMDPTLWDLFLNSEEGKRELYRQGVEAAASFLNP
jgi:predicted acylesterase/phospholipase RssA